MYEILLVVHFIIAALLIGLVLIQHGKGAQAGAAFGSGASQTIFGSQGSGGFLSQATWILAALFFTTSITLAYLINRSMHHADITVPHSHSVPVNHQSQEEHSPSSVPGDTNGSPSNPVSGGDVPEVP